MGRVRYYVWKSWEIKSNEEDEGGRIAEPKRNFSNYRDAQIYVKSYAYRDKESGRWIAKRDRSVEYWIERRVEHDNKRSTVS